MFEDMFIGLNKKEMFFSPVAQYGLFASSHAQKLLSTDPFLYYA